MGIQFRQAIPIEENYPLEKTPASFDMTAEIRFLGEGWAGFHIGVDEKGNG